MSVPPRLAGPAAVAAASAALRSGRMVLVVDEQNGRCRGDLVMAAEHATAPAVHAMSTLGRGLLHVAMRSAALDALGIPPADPTATGPGRALFRMSVGLAGQDATGIGASQRANTIRALADPASTPKDFTRPGHIFPLGCAAGGVLSVPAPPEAAVDLVEQAGMAPAGVLCEVSGADGELAAPAELLELGRAHEVPVLSIGDLVAYRRRELCRVKRRGVARIPLPAGEFRAVGFTDGFDREHVAFVHGDPADAAAPVVRIHFECLVGDVLGSRRCGCRGQLEQALHRIAQAGCGVLVYVRARSSALGETLRACAGDAETPGRAAHPVGHTDLQSAFDILDELGMGEIRLLTAEAETPLAPEHVRVLQHLPLAAVPVSPTVTDRIGSAS